MHAWLQEIVEKSRIVYQPLDWRDICQQTLEEKEQQRLSSDRLTFGNHQIDDVYVALGLVERHKVTEKRENIGAEGCLTLKSRSPLAPLSKGGTRVYSKSSFLRGI
ncbi:hypothetical protein [Microcoleus sp.]|uniref:hypothetical protein n=1 Tax=Microcoleus sp. TaxID=44472 RepID=UPI0035237BE4